MKIDMCAQGRLGETDPDTRSKMIYSVIHGDPGSKLIIACAPTKTKADLIGRLLQVCYQTFALSFRILVFKTINRRK